MEDKQLNEKESLELIARMIQNTQQKFEKGNGVTFLIWGYTTIVVSLLVWYLLTTTGDYRMHYLWFLIPIIGTPITWLFYRKQEKGVKTYIDKIVSYVWIVLGFTGFLVSLTAMFYWKIPILFVIILLMGSGTALTGLIIKFKPIAIAGFIGLLLSLCCLFANGIDSILVFAAVFLVMMVIPGHILNARGKR